METGTTTQCADASRGNRKLGRYVWNSTSRVFLLLIVGTGCAQVLDFPQDAELAPVGPWRCIEELAEVAESSQDTGTEPFTGTEVQGQASIVIDVCDFVAGCPNAVTGLTAKICDKRDIGCQQPLQTGIVDEAGRLSIQVPIERGGFDGYVTIQPPAASCADSEVFGANARAFCALVPNCELDTDPEETEEATVARLLSDPACFIPTYIPGILFLNPPVTADSDRPIVVPLFKTRDFSTILGSGGASVDPTRGNLFITAYDCDGQTATGVTYELPEVPDAVIPIYARDGVPSTGILQTDQSGVGGFVGVPAGFVEVRAFTEDDQYVGEVGIQTEAFSVSYVAMAPGR